MTLKVTLDLEDIWRVQDMLRQRIHGEWELAEDLQALGRPVDEPLARAALCVRIDAALETAKAVRLGAGS